MVEPVSHFPTLSTYADLQSWSGDERWELIAGVLYDMTPAPTRRHQEITVALLVQFHAFLKGSTCRAYTAPFDVRLPKPGEDSMSASTVVQPDLTIVCEREKLDEHGCIGSPTLVVEILSPRTTKKDQRIKLHLYEQAGVPEYWIVFPAEKMVYVYTFGAEHLYGDPEIYLHSELLPVKTLPGLMVELTSVFEE